MIIKILWRLFAMAVQGAFLYSIHNGTGDATTLALVLGLFCMVDGFVTRGMWSK